MIDEKDFIIKSNKHGEKRKFYKTTCNNCGVDRGYKRNKKTYADALCRSCSQTGQIKNIDKYTNVDFDDFIQNKDSKSYKTKCNFCNKDKGYIRKKDAQKPCLSCAAKTRHQNMNKEVKNLLKIKNSCTQRNIDIEDFDNFTTAPNEKERSKFKSSDIRQECFQNADHTCDLYGMKGSNLNAHHLDSWHDNEDKRFDLNNLVCLSEAGHKTFHKKYGNKNNTKEQYEEFKAEIEGYKKTKQDLFLIAGCVASGKSWVCDQLVNKFNYVSYDKTNKNYHVYELLKNNDKRLLYDPTIKISTFTKRYGHLFNIRLVVIVEDENVINQRMISRGGTVTDTVKRRIKRMSNLSKKCEFSGTSSEVLNYLSSK